MLVLSRRSNESIRIGETVVVTVLEVHGDHVRLGIDAPRDVEVHRQEVYDSIQAANRLAASPSAESVVTLGQLVPTRATTPDQSIAAQGTPVQSIAAEGGTSGTATP